MEKTIEIPEGYEARIKGNKVILERRKNEGERINRAIFKALSKKEARDVLRDEHIQVSDALAYLERQNSQKPAEWDEDDDAVANLILKELEQDKEDSPDYSRHFTRLIDWFTGRLNYLRPQPHWKPSEEQIDALERAIVKMHTPDDIGILAELRDNLKKL